MLIHKSSLNDGATIGIGTRIWHYCHICKGAVIGKNCNIGDYVYIGPGVVIGNNVKIQNNVSVYSGVTIGTDCFIGPSVIFTNVNRPNALLSQEYVKTVIQNRVVIGAGAMIRCGIIIGEGAFIGMGAVVLHNIPKHTTVVGNPAKEINNADK